MSRSRPLGALALAALVGSVIAANAAIERFGVVPIGFGLHAPAAVYVVGVALVARDLVHTHLGRWWAAAGILAGAALTLLVAPGLALASAAAFLASETVDLLVYDRACRRDWLGAVVVSSAAGLVVDSLVFLGLAPGLGYDLLPGQLVGKAIAVAAAASLLAAARLARSRPRLA